MAEGSVVEEQDQEDKSESEAEHKNSSHDHPVYREISYTNGKINKMKKDEVKRCLAELGLDHR